MDPNPCPFVFVKSLGLTMTQTDLRGLAAYTVCLLRCCILFCFMVKAYSIECTADIGRLLISPYQSDPYVTEVTDKSSQTPASKVKCSNMSDVSFKNLRILTQQVKASLINNLP